MIRLHPRSALFPYTTLFRSVRERHDEPVGVGLAGRPRLGRAALGVDNPGAVGRREVGQEPVVDDSLAGDRKSTRLNSSHANISYAVFCLKKKNFYCCTSYIN